MPIGKMPKISLPSRNAFGRLPQIAVLMRLKGLYENLPPNPNRQHPRRYSGNPIR